MATYELEIPAVYLDGLVLETSSPRLSLGDRDPEPSETGVPVSQIIGLSILDTGASPGISVPNTKVYIQGVLAFDGSSFQGGFNGAGSSISITASVVRLTVQLLSIFSSLETVTVRVVSATTDAVASFDTTYSFVCADLTPPMLIAAVAQDLRRVRLTFSEPVIQDDPTSYSDGLNPANYEFTRLSVPAVNVLPQSAMKVTDSILDITTDIDLSPGAEYQVLVVNVVDAFANAIVAPYNLQIFDAFVPPSPPGRVWDIYRWIPAVNRGEDLAGTGDLKKFIACIQEPSTLMLARIDKFVEIFDPDYAPQPFLDRILLDLGNPFVFDLSDLDKRRLIQILVAIYKQKGTSPGIINAVRFFVGVDVTIDNYNGVGGWSLGDSELGEDSILGPAIGYLRYSFQVLSAIILTPTQRDQINQIVAYMKPAWTHYIRLVEPGTVDVIDHLELGLSELGDTWILH